MEIPKKKKKKNKYLIDTGQCPGLQSPDLTIKTKNHTNRGYNMKNISFTTRDQARAFARNVNSKVITAARLRQPVKDAAGQWVIPGISHGKTLSLAK